MILTYNEKENRIQEGKITDVQSYQHKMIIEIIFDDGTNIFTTPSHPILTAQG
jgi:hypothetical protein